VRPRCNEAKKYRVTLLEEAVDAMGVTATLVFLRRGDEVLLIRKKRGFGAGKLNGVGGKLEEGENLEEAAAREVMEEVGVRVKSLKYAGRLEFYSGDPSPDWVVHVYVTADFEGEPRLSDEAEPRWYNVRELPFNEMWEDDRYWLPHVLNGKEVNARFWFNDDYTMLLRYALEVK